MFKRGKEMKIKKRILAVMGALGMLLTSCGHSDEEVTTTTLPVKVVEEVLQTSIQDDSSTPEIKGDEEELNEIQKTDLSISEMESNISDTIDLSLVNVNNTWCSINTSLGLFLDDVGIQKCSWSSISNGEDEMFFLGNGYGIMSDTSDPTSFYGTQLGIECYNKNSGNLAKTIEDSNLERYNIKAVVASSENTKEDFEIKFYNSIKVGMTANEIERALGIASETESQAETSVTTEPVLSETVPVTENVTETEITETQPLETTAPESETETGTPTNKDLKEKKNTQTSSPDSGKNASISKTLSKAKAGAEVTESSETVSKASQTTTTISDVSPPESTVTSDTAETETTTVTTPAVTTAPEIISEPVITSDTVMTETKEPEYPTMMHFKNTNNTIIILLKDGIVYKIYLYNNNTQSS